MTTRKAKGNGNSDPLFKKQLLFRSLQQKRSGET
jgi:hypothetical protein